jgi:hypothetical protein
MTHKKLVYICTLLAISNQLYSMEQVSLHHTNAQQEAAFEPIDASLTCLLELTPAALAAPRDLGDIKVLHADKTFMILHEGKLHIVHNYNINKNLRGISTEGLANFLSQNGYVQVQRKSDGQFVLDAQFRLNGGGAGGATVGFLGGKVLVHLVAHSVILGIATAASPFVTPGGGYVIAATLEGFLAVPIEATSNVVGLGCGIAAGVATGPV